MALFSFWVCASVTSYMENQGQVNLCICLFVGISLMGFSVFGFCIDSSSFPSKGGTSEQNLDLENSKSGSFGYSTYIMQSYFEKYECLDDSRYKDFVAQELPLGLCDAPADNLNLAPGLSVLERKLIGEGSHRHLSSSIRISIQPRSIYELSHCNCGVILIERLPCGVFADPFELQHLLHRGVLNDIAVFGDTNLESPSFLSNRSAVEVHMDVGCNFLRQKTEIDIKLDIPLHARYQLFPGKLKSRWSGPFLVSAVFSHGAVELQETHSRRKFLVNGQRIKHYLGGPVDRCKTSIILQEA
ncbi:Phosphatidylinositol-glycan biosynthesis class X protein [Morus notabilis]|uniref:Phosphatidylinositol-glycan biosynthesis class X protein n=1 Tax=Morus notabilis TaxID=981085 RepID=W9RBE4_9ROSA|nr:Phosphatidylinositol-glycan biosynthesis class X protein [Morus notabilis]